jgi:hypothetical protein
MLRIEVAELVVLEAVISDSRPRNRSVSAISFGRAGCRESPRPDKLTLLVENFAVLPCAWVCPELVVELTKLSCEA